MKYLILLIILAIIFLCTYTVWFTTSETEMIDEIKKVEKDFEKEFWQKNCKIKWTNVSLWAVMYALAIQEWWRKDGTLWDKTNNRWSLHGTMNVKKPVKFVKWDWTKTRPVYKTAYDWLYEKARMITHKKVYNKCDIWYKQLYAYIVWPNAKPNNKYIWNNKYTNQQRVSNRLNKLLSNAQLYDQSDISKTNTTKSNTKWYNTKCIQKWTIKKWQYLQIDNADWAMNTILQLLIGDKIFVCNT